VNERSHRRDGRVTSHSILGTLPVPNRIPLASPGPLTRPQHRSAFQLVMASPMHSTRRGRILDFGPPKYAGKLSAKSSDECTVRARRAWPRLPSRLKDRDCED
jgi:hypothetical protein